MGSNCNAGFVPIGQPSNPFNGTFNGQGNVISNLVVNLPTSTPAGDYAGLFGYVGGGGVITNVGLLGGSVTGENFVGALVGQNNGTLTQSYASTTVNGATNVGGLVGVNTGTIMLSYAAGSVNGTTDVGGLSGLNAGTVYQSYATGAVAGTTNVGGLIGFNSGSYTFTLYDAAAAFEQGWLNQTNPNGVWSYGYSSGPTGPVTLYSTTVQNGVNGPNAQYWLTPSVDAGTSPAAEFNHGPAHADGNIDFLANQLASRRRDRRAIFQPRLHRARQRDLFARDDIPRRSEPHRHRRRRRAERQRVVQLRRHVGRPDGAIQHHAQPGGRKPSRVFGRSARRAAEHRPFRDFLADRHWLRLAVVRDGPRHRRDQRRWPRRIQRHRCERDRVRLGQADDRSDARRRGTILGSFGATGLTTAQFGNTSNFTNWTFGTTPGASGWVIVDTNGSLNNPNGTGATRPMLLSEYSTTITNAHQLELANLDLGAHYRLASNIDLGAALANPSDVFAPNGAAGFVPIGNVGNPFSGRFNGHGYTIAGLTIAPTDSQVNSIGLFGANLGTIKNLTLTDVSITANPNAGLPGQFVGTLTGQNFGLISNVTASGTINGLDIAGVTAGGLVGQNGSLGADTQSARITRSHANVSVTLGDGILCIGSDCNGGFNNAGGLVGFNVATIDRSSASGTIVVGANTFAGGLVGTNQNANFNTDGPPIGLSGPRIANSWASGNVSSPAGGVALGGLVGDNAPLAVIWNSHATGNVTSTAARSKDCSPDCPIANAGGLVGQNQGEIRGHRLPSADSDCTAGFTCASGLVTVGPGETGGGLVGENQGIIRNAFATGNVIGAAGPGGGAGDFDHTTTIGGLVGGNEGTISHTFATGAVGTGGIVSHDFSTDVVSVTPVANLDAGGLVGDNGGIISHSRAYGTVTAGANSLAGGLAGDNSVPKDTGCSSCVVGDGFNQLALISHSAAFGNVMVGSNSVGGGLVGISSGTVRHARAGGSVTGGDNSVIAGLVGVNDLSGLIKYSLAGAR